MEQLHEYENDFHFNVMIKTGINKDTLLEFIFKKGGKVNVTSMTYLILSAGQFKSNLSQSINELMSAGLVKCINDEYEYCMVTTKARWQRLRDNKTIQFVLLIIGIIVAVLALSQ